MILAHLAVVDLLDRDIGESEVVEETASRTGQRSNRTLHIVCGRRAYLAAERSTESAMVD
jgi:hypothetical protein